MRIARITLLLLMAAFARAQDDGPSPVKSGDADDRRAKLEARQLRARELMAELEDRMFELSELLSSNHPDDAARLVLGLRKAREELILEDMEEIEQHLKDGEFDEAAELQRGVIRRLAELRDLLLSTDLDLLLKLERLHKMNSLLTDLAALDAQQGEIQERTEGIESESDAEAKQQKAKGAEMAQADAQQTAQDLESDMREATGEESEASEAMQQAAEEMQKAEEELSQQQSSEASKSQSKARENMQKAKDKLQQEREELLWELQPHIRRQVIDSLTRIRDQLEKVNGGLVAAIGEETSPVELDARDSLGWLDRIRAVGDIARDTQELVRETEFSVHLDDLLDWSELRLRPLARGLATEEAGTVELAGSQRVHALVEEMLESLLEEDKRMRSARGDERTQRLIKVVGELKGVRALQRILREDTAQFDSGTPGGGLAAASPEEVQHLYRLEGEVAKMLLELDAQYMQDLLDSSGDD